MKHANENPLSLSARKNCFYAEVLEADMPISKFCSSFEKQI
jgi:hypothetical protein